MRWHGELSAWLAALEATRGRGVDKMLTELQAKFDHEQVKRAANSLGADTRFLHESGKLRMDNLTGKVGMIGSAIPKTINFGGGEN
jgi:hypothetical protein